MKDMDMKDVDMKDVEELGAFKRSGDQLDVRFERYYPRSIDKVWSALTDPKRLEDWMGVARVEPYVGGRYDLMLDGPHPMTGRILVWEPPRVLEFTWSNADAPDSVVRYELTRQGDGARLIFTHTGMPYASSALMLPGWHVLLALLGSLLDGAIPPRSKQSWREMQTIYVDHYELRGVALDIQPPTNGSTACVSRAPPRPE
jgi:uncharacterized protein YndB with AHSA1/START domain